MAAQALDVLAGGDQQRAGVCGGDRDARGCRRRCGRDELLELAVKPLDLGVEVERSACERPEGGLGGVQRLVQSRLVGAQPGAERRKLPVDSSPIAASGPNRRTQFNSSRYPQPLAGNARLPSSRPQSSSTAATWLSVWESTPTTTPRAGSVMLSIAVLSFQRAARPGSGGQNSDQALVASRFL